MFLFPGLLVFVKDDRIWLQFTGTLHPHPALSSCRTSILAYLYHGFIRMHHMMLRKFLLHPVIYTAQLPLCSHDRPAAQGLCREKYIAAFKLFGKALALLHVYILQIINTGNQGRGSQTVPEQFRRTLCARKISPIHTYIYFHVMFSITSKLAGWNSRRLYTSSGNFLYRPSGNAVSSSSSDRVWVTTVTGTPLISS